MNFECWNRVLKVKLDLGFGKVLEEFIKEL